VTLSSLLRGLCVLLLVSLCSRAYADARSEAAEHFRVGVELVDRHRWDSALAEFRRSNELFATSGALENAAVCLRELGRFDEALDAYDELVTRFSATMTQANRAAVDADARRIEQHVGAIAVTSPIVGAEVVVDGRARGRTPLAKPVRVTAGAHTVRVVAAGRAPFEAQAHVSPKDSVSVVAELGAVARVGEVRVVESSGRVFEVLVDGGSVGVTPWHGTLVVGEHTFALRGENDFGAEPVTRTALYDETATVTLGAHLLPGIVRIEPDPAQATILIDGTRVSRGAWTGSIASGDHTVDVSAPWAEPLALRIHASSEHPLAVRPSLERIRRFYAELDGGILFGDTRQGIGGCEDASCVGNPGFAHVGYMVARHFGVDAFIGGLAFNRRTSVPVLMQSSVSASFIGAEVAYEMFERTPLLLRLGFAVTSGNTFVSSSGVVNGAEVTRGPNGGNFISGSVIPEVRFGYRITRAVVIDLGVSVMFFVLPSIVAGANDHPESGLPLPTVSPGLAFVVPITLGFRLFL